MQNNKYRVLPSILFTSLAFISSVLLISLFSDVVFAEESFTIEAKINMEKIDNPEKLKVAAFANHETKTKYIEDKEVLKSSTITVPFTFSQKNNIVTVGNNDEYFVCAYNINAKTGSMKSYACHEGDIESIDGKNTIGLDSFQPVNQTKAHTKNVKIDILVPLSDRRDIRNITAVTMTKGEFMSKEIDAGNLLKNSDGDTIRALFTFDRETEIGQIQQGDMYFACVSANELNPPEGTECEHKLTKIISRENNLYAR